ncbi:MAG: Gfo/Idh/MocA family oxidoreductase [Bryobacterales bacterium]|nr:Gfo/Idh/MocA family oxidoreductase [Bryobacterales bacterium]
MTYRVGLAGCGWIAPYQLRGWNMLRRAEVVAVCDSDEARSRSLAAVNRIPWAGGDAVRMIEECRLDVLDIATSPQSHKAIALAAVERGVHVLCQKPVALCLEDAEEMIERAARCGVVLYVNEMLRFCPWFRQAYELLQSGSMGKPVYARLSNRTAGLLEVGPKREAAYGFRDFLKYSERVIMLEETIHYLDVMRYLFGEPTSIYAVTGHISSLIKGEDIATIVMRYPSMIAVVEDSWCAHGPDRSGLEIEGLEGSIFLSHAKVLESYSADTGKIEKKWDFSVLPWNEQRPHVFAKVFNKFLSTIETKTDFVTQAQDNLKTLRLTLMAYESAASGAPVNL